VGRGASVVQTYGLTEACSQVTTLGPADAKRRLGSAGRPLLTTHLRIEEGEILVQGQTVAPGCADADGWLHTGDLGRIDEETTANVGEIRGGTAANIIPEWCSLVAEARSHDDRKLTGLVQEMQDAVTFAAGIAECQVETKMTRSYRAYRFKRGDLAIRLAAEALERCGFEPTYGLSGGAADANVFNERGLQCVNLANGMAEIHTPDEHIAVADLEAMVDVTLALVDAAASSTNGAAKPSVHQGK